MVTLLRILQELFLFWAIIFAATRQFIVCYVGSLGMICIVADLCNCIFDLRNRSLRVIKYHRQIFILIDPSRFSIPSSSLARNQPFLILYAYAITCAVSSIPALNSSYLSLIEALNPFLDNRLFGSSSCCQF